MNEKVISYDLGTGGIKASLFKRRGSTFRLYPLSDCLPATWLAGTGTRRLVAGYHPFHPAPAG